MKTVEDYLLGTLMVEKSSQVTGRKLNLHKTFRLPSERLMYDLLTSRIER